MFLIMDKEQYAGDETTGDPAAPRVAQIPEDGGSGRSDAMLPISIVIAAVLISGSIWYTMGGRGNSLNPQQADVGAATAGALQNLMTLGGRDVVLGDQNAPVTLIEYGDYQCPFCARFFTDSEPQIRAHYIQTGKAKIVFRNLAFLGPESIASAAAAECAKDQNQFWAYHDALYSAKINDTINGGSENDGYFTAKVFVSLATALKMNVGSFAQCIATKKYDPTIVSGTSIAENAGVASTPTLYVNGIEIKGAQLYAIFASAIDAALKKVK